MRIVPLALAFRQASDEQLYEAVRMAIISSHVHPEGVDGAFVLAKAIILALQCDSADDFDPLQFLSNLRSTSRTAGMREQIEKLITFYNKRCKVSSTEKYVLESIIKTLSRDRGL
jgi:ADP-ribosylglycohydrolase